MDVNQWHKETIGAKAVEALKKNGFDAVYFASSNEASDYIMNYIDKGSNVGFGGSMTVKDMGIQEKTLAKGGLVLDHSDPLLSPEERLEVMRKELISDVFICSSNAVTLDGELVNIDGSGNRVAAMTFGPKKVLIAVGVNKICKNEIDAFERIKLVASPKNNKRLDYGNPCSKVGACVDCSVESRICRVYSVLRKRPRITDITVIVIGEELGY
ncbi:MAG: lactate utilization protein [Bacillota bacterium]|nr:lactate utilization protein [Bacillota bacterium]